MSMNIKSLGVVSAALLCILALENCVINGALTVKGKDGYKYAYYAPDAKHFNNDIIKAIKDGFAPSKVMLALNYREKLNFSRPQQQEAQKALNDLAETYYTFKVDSTSLREKVIKNKTLVIDILPVHFLRDDEIKIFIIDPDSKKYNNNNIIMLKKTFIKAEIYEVPKIEFLKFPDTAIMICEIIEDTLINPKFFAQPINDDEKALEILTFKYMLEQIVEYIVMFDSDYNPNSFYMYYFASQPNGGGLAVYEYFDPRTKAKKLLTTVIFAQ